MRTLAILCLGLLIGYAIPHLLTRHEYLTKGSGT